MPDAVTVLVVGRRGVRWLAAYAFFLSDGAASMSGYPRKPRVCPEFQVVVCREVRQVSEPTSSAEL